jgi:hypothetical protein
MIRPPCRSGHCVLCHGPISTTSPHFVRHTALSRDRLTLAKRYRRVQPSKPSKVPSRFLQLPLEIRLLIYAFCFRTCLKETERYHICHSVEGGAWHLDNPNNWQSYPFQLYVYGIVPANLLRVNKQIHKEATREVYRLTAVRMCNVSPACLPTLDYWLRKHPLRYTRFLMTGSFAYPGQGLWSDTTTRTDMERFVRVLNAMPNLEDLLVNFDYWYLADLPNMRKPRLLHLSSSWIRNLVIVRDGLREKVTLRLRGDPFSTDHANRCYCYGYTLLGHRTVTEVVGILQRNGFSLTTPSSPWNVSKVKPPFEMRRTQTSSIGGPQSKRILDYRRRSLIRPEQRK